MRDLAICLLSGCLGIAGCFSSPATVPPVTTTKPIPAPVPQPIVPTQTPPQPANGTTTHTKKASQPHKPKKGKQNCVGYDCTHVWSTYIP